MDLKKRAAIASLVMLLSFGGSAYADVRKVDSSRLIQYREIQSSDTVAALKNLFQRKRKGGRTKAVVFGFLGGGAVVAGASGNRGTSGNFVLAGIFGIISITGMSQYQNYSHEKEAKCLDQYSKEGVLDPKIKAKLRRKDFR